MASLFGGGFHFSLWLHIFSNISEGIAAAEVVKILCGVGTPLRQLHFHESLPRLSPSSALPFLEPSFLESLTKMRVLVAGMGGIGTEVVKNLVLMGIGSK